MSVRGFDITKNYNREEMLDFLRDFLPDDFEQIEEQTFFEFTNIEEGYKLGFSDSLNLDVYEFRTRSNRDPRVTLTKEVVSCIKNYGYNPNALAIFYSLESNSWRFSLITTDYSFEDGKLKRTYSNPRRFSFKLGKDCKRHTPEQMLFSKGQIRERTENGKTLTAIEDLKSRFAIEVVSNEFFNEYKVFYEDFVQYITGNRFVKTSGNKYEKKTISEQNKEIFNQFEQIANGDYELACKYVRDYIKKLMGRLVFLHFLQKKGWLGVNEDSSWGDGNKSYLLDLFKKSSSTEQENFLEMVLEPLFFGMLNTPEEERNELFQEKKWNIQLLETFYRIPYLNGGLFESDKLDELKVTFPKELFSNENNPDKERKFQGVIQEYPFTECCGLLDFFERYNFTIDETDPSDMEIGVDPEMLGKIFENLLEDNKDKGAFYTPKEIVQYMCRESLIAYLLTDSKIEEEKIRNFVIQHIDNFTESEKSELIQKLKSVKICDPAVGSGAFPMGMLNELYACRHVIEEDTSPVDIKKEIVKENIYGVDIEKGAVDIARLRFWLAIIVDETEPIPLPNLDYKIMQGNSLLECYEGIDLSNLTKRDELSGKGKDLFNNWIDPEDEVKELKNSEIEAFDYEMKRYFDISHAEKKQVHETISEIVRKRIIDLLEIKIKREREQSQTLDSIIAKIHEGLSSLSKTPDDPAYIKLQKELDKNVAEQKEILIKINEVEVKQKEIENLSHENDQFFLWHTWFNDVFNRPNNCNGGFDIVIGNPPYIKEYENKNAFDGFRENSPYYMGKMDLWYGFACHGLDLLRKNGHLCFIAQNNWTTSTGAKLLRKKIVDSAKICQLLDFNTYMVFESASIQTMIMLFQNNSVVNKYTFDYRTLLAEATKIDMIDLLNKTKTENTKLLSPSFDRVALAGKLLTFSENDLIFEKIADGKVFLNEDEVAQGIVFPQDFLNKKGAEELGEGFIQGEGIFGLTHTELNTMNLSKTEEELIKPYYTSDEIYRYVVDTHNSLWMIYTDSSFKNPEKMKLYPVLKQHLDKYKKIFTSDNKPYGLHRARDKHFFQGEKIISQRKCVGIPVFSYCNFDTYVSQTYFVIKTSRWNMKFLTGILNSKLIAFWLRHKGKMQGANYQVDKEPLLTIPLPNPETLDKNIEMNIIKLVENIISTKKDDISSNTSIYESEIDRLVYKLYGLKEDEVAIIENK